MNSVHLRLSNIIETSITFTLPLMHSPPSSRNHLFLECPQTVCPGLYLHFFLPLFTDWWFTEMHIIPARDPFNSLRCTNQLFSFRIFLASKICPWIFLAFGLLQTFITSTDPTFRSGLSSSPRENSPSTTFCERQSSARGLSTSFIPGLLQRTAHPEGFHVI
ncbi:hypothetical protein EI94DRAFT_1340248 [Lactarius quietus]|nr:hypothetical protein EI94DRAFT_1340248 [Lactarius quietus]